MSTQESTEKKHSSFGDKLKGAAHVVHGIGEDIRGSVMGALESVSGSEEAKAKNEGIASKGKAEIEQGVAQMKGVVAPSTATAGPEPHVEARTGELQAQEQPAKEETSGITPAPPPSPVQSRQAEPEVSTSRQESVGQTGMGKVQPSSQETEAGDKGQIGEGTPQGPGSSV